MQNARTGNLLNRVLTVNAMVSGLTGLVLFFAAHTVDDLIGSGAPMAVRVIGGGLVLFAAGLFAVGRLQGPRLRSGTALIFAMDVAWVVASLVAVAARWFNGVGNVVVLAVAVVVGAFAVGELVGMRRLGTMVESEPG